MNIIMKKQTLYKGDTLKVGCKTSIDNRVAERWIRNKIAEHYVEYSEEMSGILKEVGEEVIKEAERIKEEVIEVSEDKIVPIAVEMIDFKEEETQEVTEDVPLFGLCNDNRASDIPRNNSSKSTSGRNKTTHKSK